MLPAAGVNAVGSGSPQEPPATPSAYIPEQALLLTLGFVFIVALAEWVPRSRDSRPMTPPVLCRCR
jgi:hypothetical protein